MTFIGVCGGRGYRNRDAVARTLAAAVREFSGSMVVVVHGAARGADTMANEEAKKLRLHQIPVEALWKVYPIAAGPIRNSIIAALPLRRLYAFPGGNGTADMVRKARAAGIEVVEVNE